MCEVFVKLIKICLLCKFKIRGVDRLESYPESLKRETEEIKERVRNGNIKEDRIKEIAETTVEFLKSEEKRHKYFSEVAAAMADNLSEFFKSYLKGE